MILYLVKGYLDLAATTLADAQALLTALANPALASNQAIIDKVTGKLETLVQSDSGEPLTISSIDDTAGSYSAWVTDAQTTLAVGLGLPNTSTLDTYASTTSFSITGNTRTGTLALNTRELSNGLLRGGLRLQIRTTNSAGAAETRALLRINVVPGVLESPVGDRDVDYTSYVEVAALATAAAASAAAATTAETNAETAETNAETAQAAAAISAAAALVSENAASASASTATTQAGTATTQAGTATTQAGIATTQAGLATTAKTAAETAETNAETAETNAAASATAAGVSAAAALVSEAAALVSKNAAAASAATASAVSGSGNGTFSAAALTGVNSITASASTALTLTGGSTGASLVLGHTAGASMSSTSKLNLSNTTSASSSTVGALTIGNGSTATNVAIGGGRVDAGDSITAGSGTAVLCRVNASYPGALNVTAASNVTSDLFGYGDGTRHGLIRGNQNGANISDFRFGYWASPTFTESFRVTTSGSGVGNASTAVNIYGTSASTGAGFGALQVAGGIYAGAASVFGGTVTAGGVTTLAANSVLAVKAAVGTAAVYVSDSATATPGATSPGVYFASSTRGGYYRNASGVLQLIDESAPGAGDGAVRTSVNMTTGAATFAGAVTIAGTVIHTLSATPASASATGTVGTMSWDANYIYICTATNTWKRVAIATW